MPDLKPAKLRRRAKTQKHLTVLADEIGVRALTFVLHVVLARLSRRPL